MAPQMCLRTNDYFKVAKRMLALYDWVTGLGYQMNYIGPTPSTSSDSDMSMVLNMLEKERTGAVLRLEIAEESEEYFMRWPKDGLQLFENFTAIADSPIINSLVNQLGLKNTISSDLREGGLMVQLGKIILLSSAIKHPKELDKIKSDYRIFNIPEPFANIAYRKAHPDSAFGKTHIDLDCNIVLTAKNEFLFLVSELYYKVYTDIIDQISEAIKASIFVVPQEEVNKRVLNLISFPLGGVVMPDNCPVTANYLLKNLEKETIYQVHIDDYFNYNSGIGGLGCMSNILFPV